MDAIKTARRAIRNSIGGAKLRIPIAFVFLLAACGSRGKAYGLGPEFTIEAGSMENAHMISRDVFIIADTQFHHGLGSAGWMRSGLVDKYVGSAIRPPLLDLFVGDLASWFLDLHGITPPIIHLGDVADLSCWSEVREFEAMMARYVARKRGTVPWFITPGNHDGYFFGNFWDDPKHPDNTWKRACAWAQDEAASKPFTHDQVVQWVVDTAKNQPDVGAREMRGDIDNRTTHDVVHRVETDIDRQAKPPLFRLLTGIAWKVDTKAPWRSFVTQRLDLSGPNAPAGSRRITAILIDTASYQYQPVLVPKLGYPNAGTEGDIHSEQRRVVLHWAEIAHKRGDVLVVMGHHPYKELSKQGRQLFDKLHEDLELSIYVSAHTHAGRWFAHESRVGQWAELNVGSMISSPIEFRSFQVFVTEPQTPKEVPRIAIHTPLHRVDETVDRLSWTKLPACRDHLGQGKQVPKAVWECGATTDEVPWEALHGAPDEYVRYNYFTHRSKDTERELLDMLLASYQRLIAALPEPNPWGPRQWTDQQACEKIRDARANPSVDAKRRLLGDLAKVEPLRSSTDAAREQRRDYRVCQAMWASTADDLGGRIPKVDDSSLYLPPRKERSK